MITMINIFYVSTLTYLIGHYNMSLGAAYLGYVAYSAIVKAEQLRRCRETIKE